MRNPGGFLELENVTVVPLLFPNPIKLVGATANDLLCMLVENGHPSLTSGIRDLGHHDVSQRALRVILLAPLTPVSGPKNFSHLVAGRASMVPHILIRL